MKYILAPSILSSDLSQAGQVIKDLILAEIEWIHFDIMDGQFVPPITFGADFIRCLKKPKNVKFEAHLMTLSPEKQFQSFIKAGCDRIIFHAEATHHSYRLALELKSMGISPGIAINPGTSIESIVPLLHVIDLALIMTVNPGWGGQSFLFDVLSKITALRQMAPDLNIEVDGGIDPLTLPLTSKAGANVFVSGSYMFREKSIEIAARKLRASIEADRNP